jgi:hypothetical protein
MAASGLELITRMILNEVPNQDSRSVLIDSTTDTNAT